MKSILVRLSGIQLRTIVLMVGICLMSFLTVAQKDLCYLYIGTYTQKGSEGIYVYQFNAATGEFKPLSVAKGNSNPSFLAISPDQRFLYAPAGNKGDSVKAFSIDKSSHQLSWLNSQSLSGSNG